MRRDHLNAFLSQFLVQLVAVVRTITNQNLRLCHDRVEVKTQLDKKLEVPDFRNSAVGSNDVT